jgi:hypothetical protein
VNTLSAWLNDIGRTGWFSYVTIFLLQVKSIWGIWRWRDLTDGDTESYFVMAYRWFNTGRVPMAWSPLYTSFYGTLLRVSTDAFSVTILHRVIIVLALAILVLALMRQLLPAGLAWMAAAWWVVLPIDFNSLYEVHLFAVIPILLAVLAILWMPGPSGRGWGLAVLLVAAILVRNEYLPAALLFAAACFAWELLSVRWGAIVTPRWGRAYGIPVAIACLPIIFFYLRNSENLSDALVRKHTISVCQPYAFGYQQRHADWQGSPWTECGELMTRDFGMPRPSLLEALRRNPRAIREHFLWNLQLVPNGLQVLLLNGMTGSVNPDYAAVNRYSLALPASLLICIVVLGGVFVLRRDWEYWWKIWLKDRVWAWVAMLCVACVAPSIILTQRPRPSYLLAFGIFLRAAIAMCAFALAPRGLRFQYAGPLAPLAVILLLALAPAYYPYVHAPRTLATLYETLAPFHQWIEQPDAGLVTAGRASDLCLYIAHSRSCRPLDFSDLRRQVTPELSLSQVLDKNRASVFFAEATVLDDPAGRLFVSEAKSDGWRLIAMRHDSQRDWDLFVKPMNAIPAPERK